MNPTWTSHNDLGEPNDLLLPKGKWRRSSAQDEGPVGLGTRALSRTSASHRPLPQRARETIRPRAESSMLFDSGADHRLTLWPTRAFTLVELLVVISIIGVLAALIIPVAASVGRVKKINTAQAEMQQLETALENYKAKYGVYPPSNSNSVLTNSLFYELTGVTNTGSAYLPSDGSPTVLVSDYTGWSGLGGVVNCSKGGGEDTIYAKDFLPGLKANEIASTTNASGSTFFYLVTSVSGPDVTYQPVAGYSFNPFRYLYPGINNPNSYDLWVKLVIKGQTNLISNWSQQVPHNTSLP